MERTILIDDLDGSTEGVKTRTFAIDGVVRDIDLNEENHQRLRTALSQFIQAGRARSQPKGNHLSSVKGDRITAPPRGPARIDKAQRDFIREWVKKNTDLRIADRGMIPSDALAAFQRAHEASGERRQELVPPGFPSGSIFSDVAAG